MFQDANDAAAFGALRMLAQDLASAGHWSEVRSLLRGLLAVEPSDCWAWVALAIAERESGRLSEAREAAEQALSLDPANEEAGLQYVESCLLLGDLRRARQSLAYLESRRSHDVASRRWARLSIIVNDSLRRYEDEAEQSSFTSDNMH